ncbi:MAG: hypothetical protein JWM49_1502 [Microbacteriaceae bacterium]|jgi:hypothetical protein|nr:hypothetical protein [Microbacteriaceae bacterium]
MALFLTALSGIAWTIVYIIAIRIGFTQKTYAMPIAALGLNVSWEWIYAIYGLANNTGLQSYVNLVWALGVVLILITFFRFGRAELPSFISKRVFIAWGVSIVAVSVVIQLLFIGAFGLVHMRAAIDAAFLQNLLMSGLFISMFVTRRGARGQSVTMAVAKWIGTLAPTLLVGIIQHNPFILGIGILCSVFDLAYIGLLLRARTNPPQLAASVDPSEPAVALR